MFSYNGQRYPFDIIRKRLKFFRLATFRTQNQVAAYLGITQTAYSYYESGRSQIDVISFIRLLDLYRLSSIGEFLRVDDPQ